MWNRWKQRVRDLETENLRLRTELADAYVRLSRCRCATGAVDVFHDSGSILDSKMSASASTYPLGQEKNPGQDGPA